MPNGREAPHGPWCLLKAQNRADRGVVQVARPADQELASASLSSELVQFQV